jgi:hypothetical protein
LAQAQQGGTWDFASLAGAAPSVLPSSGIPASASDPLPGTLSTITRGSGLAATAGTAVFNASSFASGVGFNQSNNDYFEFTYTAPAVGGVRLDTVRDTVQRGSATNATQMRWYLSVNGGAFSALPGTVTLNSTNPTNQTGGLSSLRLNDGETARLRLFGWNAGNGSVSLNAVSLLTTIGFTNSLTTRTWDRGVSLGSTSIDAAPYSYFNVNSYIASFGGSVTSANASYQIVDITGPSLLTPAIDYTFNPATRVLTLNDTPNVALGLYTFTYGIIIHGVQDGVPYGPDIYDTGMISVQVVPAPGMFATILGAGTLFLARRR